ncbi:unnamed protein product, partial [Brassica oleracea]
MRSSSSSSEVAALLVPKFQGDKVAYDEFNGASFRFFLKTNLLFNNNGVLIVFMIIIGDVLAGKKEEEDVTHHYGFLEGWF